LLGEGGSVDRARKKGGDENVLHLDSE
jgi:hypothetical protein